MAGNSRKRSLPATRNRAIVQPSSVQLPPGYGSFLEDLKARIQAARVKAALSANRRLIELY